MKTTLCDTAQPVPQDVSFSEFLDSRDFYELMQAYRHTLVDAAKEFEAVKSDLCGALAQPVQPVPQQEKTK
jgi:hypothetical protein